MNTPNLEDLAVRVEQASGPSARLGAEVEIALRGFPERAYEQRNAMRPKGTPDLDRLAWAEGFLGCGPTSSLDVAVRLVPDGWAWTVTGTGYAEIRHPKLREMDCEGRAATPALALCAAALRARSEYKGGEG